MVWPAQPRWAPELPEISMLLGSLVPEQASPSIIGESTLTTNLRQRAAQVALILSTGFYNVLASGNRYTQPV